MFLHLKIVFLENPDWVLIHSKKSGVSKPFSTIREKQPIEKSKQPVVSCFYYMKKAILSDSVKLEKNLFPGVF